MASISLIVVVFLWGWPLFLWADISVNHCETIYYSSPPPLAVHKDAIFSHVRLICRVNVTSFPLPFSPLRFCTSSAMYYQLRQVSPPNERCCCGYFSVVLYLLPQFNYILHILMWRHLFPYEPGCVLLYSSLLYHAPGSHCCWCSFSDWVKSAGDGWE